MWQVGTGLFQASAIRLSLGRDSTLKGACQLKTYQFVSMRIR